jgi:hypothetical protein
MKKKFERHEKRDAKNFNCRNTPGSGNKSIKGDSIKKKSLRQEKSTKKAYKKFSSKLTIGSGNKFQKGDVTVEEKNLMIECKVTSKDSFSIKKSHLKKLYKEAFDVDKDPVFSFAFEDENKKLFSWDCIPQARLVELFDIEKKYYELLD